MEALYYSLWQTQLRPLTLSAMLYLSTLPMAHKQTVLCAINVNVIFLLLAGQLHVYITNYPQNSEVSFAEFIYRTVS